jgi:hypothetical protein
MFHCLVLFAGFRTGDAYDDNDDDGGDDGDDDVSNESASLRVCRIPG